ncbi:hypothetical protein [Flyfo microvirus Tbat2_95]|nr:hypothetical protein [Flyfo microvirus Tbat2_95]
MTASPFGPAKLNYVRSRPIPKPKVKAKKKAEPEKKYKVKGIIKGKWVSRDWYSPYGDNHHLKKPPAAKKKTVIKAG